MNITLLNGIITILISILVIGILVFIHELGHFLAAKKVGVLVQEFAFGFGPKIFSKKYKGTEYKINLYPFGGYVRMLGDLDGSSMARLEAQVMKEEDRGFVLKLFKDNKLDPKKSSYEDIDTFCQQQSTILSVEDNKKLQDFFVKDYIPNHPGNFDNIPMRKRVVVIVAGVVMNFILGVVLYNIYFANNDYNTYLLKIGNPTFIGARVTNPPLLIEFGSANFTDNTLKQSKVVKANGQYIYSADDFSKIVKDNYNKPVELTLFVGNQSPEINRKIVLDGDGINTNWDSDFDDKVLVFEVVKDGAAEKAGISVGDLILELNGQTVTSLEDWRERIQNYAGKSVEVLVRNAAGKNVQHTLQVPVVNNNRYLNASLVNTNEFKIDKETMRINYNENRLASGFFHSINLTSYTFTAMGTMVGKAFEQKSLAPVSNSVSSVFVLPDAVYSIVSFNNYLEVLNMTAMFSVSLAIMNILPIPLFDGGHLLFFAIEKLRGKRMAMKTQEKISMVVFYILIALTVLIVIKDFVQFDWINRLFNFFGSIFHQ